MKNQADAQNAIKLYREYAAAADALERLSKPLGALDVQLDNVGILGDAPAGWKVSVAIRTALVDHWTTRRDSAAHDLIMLGFAI